MVRTPRDAQRAKTTYPFRRRQPVTIPITTITTPAVTETITRTVRVQLAGGGYIIGFQSGSTLLSNSSHIRTFGGGDPVSVSDYKVGCAPGATFLCSYTMDDVLALTFDSTGSF